MEKIKPLDFSSFGIEPTREKIEKSLDIILNSSLRKKIDCENLKSSVKILSKILIAFYTEWEEKPKNLLELMEMSSNAFRLEDVLIKHFQEKLSKEL